MRKINFSVEPDLAEREIKVKMAAISVPQISRRQGSSLEKHIADELANIDVENLLNSPILKECESFYRPFNIENAYPPATHLLKLVQKSGRIPNINRAVDCYNIVSATTLLSIGAHSLDAIKGDLRFATCTGDERYTPLGQTELEKVNAGEYACMDEEKIICRMDLKQCDETKVDKNVKEFVVYVQGNKETSEDYVFGGLKKVCENLENFCQAQYSFI